MRPYAPAAALTLTLLSSTLAAQQAPPAWRWALDRPDTGWSFVPMPPGWHVTMGSGGTLWQPRVTADGRFAVESESFLFPGTSPAGHGVFVGGRDLDGPGAQYVAFLVRHDGMVAVERRTGAARSALVAWRTVTGVAVQVGSQPVKHVLRVEVDGDSVIYTVDGARAAALARGDLPLDGLVGFRVGEKVNLHITTLDVTRRFAPPRRPTGM